MKKRINLGVTWASLLLVVVSGSAHAGTVIASFAGYSELAAPCDLCDSFVNFAVYTNTDGDWTDDPFFAGLTPTPLADASGQWPAVVDESAAYVYLYQVVNNDPFGMGNENSLSNFNLSRDAGVLPTSAGFFAGNVLADEVGNSIVGGPAGDYSVADPDPALGSPSVPNDGTPTASGITATGLVALSVGVDPVSVRSGNLIANPSVDGGAPFPGIVWSWSASDDIPSCPPQSSDCTSSVLFMTSDLPPDYLWAETESVGGTGSPEDVPFPSDSGFDCRVAEKQKLEIRLAGKRRLAWRWRRGPATTKAEFGNPLVDTDYRYCIFDARQDQFTAVYCQDAPAGSNWSESKKGFSYKNNSRSVSLFQRIRLLAGGPRKARILVDEKNPAIPAILPFFQDPEVRIQLINLATGLCWEGIFPAPAGRNVPERFRDRTPR
ncbi:MAG: hypothetical protein QNK03_19300 [Myxococcota bacterium]|nr:hypothetical protein [Myxococcota bacterium]